MNLMVKTGFLNWTLWNFSIILLYQWKIFYRKTAIFRPVHNKEGQDEPDLRNFPDESRGGHHRFRQKPPLGARSDCNYWPSRIHRLPYRKPLTDHRDGFLRWASPRLTYTLIHKLFLR